jgi:hypothetical protein
MNYVYVVEHSYEVGEDGEFDETKLIGIYSSEEKAKQVIQKYIILPGFEDHPIECFYIEKYEIDKDEWAEGFEKADNTPSWVKGNKPNPGESGKDFAKRVLDERFGSGNYQTGPESDYNKIKKWGDKAFNI